MKVLVTGGAGYIGSHTLIELDKAGFDFVVFDNLCNSSKQSLKRVEKIMGKSIDFVEGDIRDAKVLSDVFENYDIDSVIHFAGLKAVGESVAKPHMYYDNNINGTLVLCEVMKKYGCKKIVFSSSATVYGDPHTTPIREDFPVGATTNPYGRTKYFIEEILKDIYVSDNTNKIVILRYFNPVGAHESGTIGEDPNGIPNNLMPFISQTAVGKRECLSVFGGDYDTHDGTGVRDYIHVVDLALGHVKALQKIDSIDKVFTVNLGTGNGYSVIDMIKAFQKASGKKVPYKIVDRRPGDIAKCFADPSYANEVLGWEALRGIDQMCEDSWRWQSNNPDGF
ncbi:UDP-glucose 4-epimerase GalE [Poseidonibacter ostreae]|uniref:UDP-glucose 4-epimerase n=1 Tax=Poseidonibacter ostreae TaxID=2654171 RepID=A0ABQ6VQ52_9BACT|nr:UDP-glucose 4-epimerase GalE [Poseidonibacter ostreae]KAB7892677.1 UDP-glucose 4-epimerase GalE [Poseidonibacter ostreae]